MAYSFYIYIISGVCSFFISIYTRVFSPASYMITDADVKKCFFASVTTPNWTTISQKYRQRHTLLKRHIGIMKHRLKEAIIGEIFLPCVLALCNVGRFSHHVNKVGGNTMVVAMLGEHTVLIYAISAPETAREGIHQPVSWPRYGLCEALITIITHIIKKIVYHRELHLFYSKHFYKY